MNHMTVGELKLALAAMRDDTLVAVRCEHGGSNHALRDSVVGSRAVRVREVRGATESTQKTHAVFLSADQNTDVDQL